MKVSHYFEFEEQVTGGIYRSVQHQRKALEMQGVEYTSEPSLESDILHLNIMGPRSVYYAKRARMKGIPVVVHSHNTHAEMDGSFRFFNYLEWPVKKWLHMAYPLADRLVCPSDYNRELVEQYAPKVEKTVLTNGVDTERLQGFEQLRGEYLERYELEPPVVFCVGHVMRRKGLKEFIEAAERNPDLDFAWFGYLDREMKDRKTLELVDNSPDNCTFTGYVEDIRGAYAAGDIFLFPTREDNEGIALLEAMTTSHPTVIRDIELFDHFNDNKDCIKFEEEPDETLERLAEDKELRDRIGRNGRERIRKDFSLEKVGRRLSKIYHELAEE